MKKDIYQALSLSLLCWRREQEERLGGVSPWLGPTTWAIISGWCIPCGRWQMIGVCLVPKAAHHPPSITHTVLEWMNNIFIFLALSVTFIGSSSITYAAGNTHMPSRAAVWIDILRWSWNKLIHHFHSTSRCVYMKHHHVVSSRQPMSEYHTASPLSLSAPLWAWSLMMSIRSDKLTLCGTLRILRTLSPSRACATWFLIRTK